MRTITGLITHIFRSLSNFESRLKDFRREEEFEKWTNLHIQAAAWHTDKASVTLCVFQVTLMIHNLSNTTLNQRTTPCTGEGNTTALKMGQSFLGKHHGSVPEPHTEEQDSRIWRSSQGEGLGEITCQLKSQWAAIILNKGVIKKPLILMKSFQCIK